MKRRLRITVRGLVQGVGFRPYVYRLATSLGLSGLVRNDLGGATVEVEGDLELVKTFQRRLTAELPPLAAVWDTESEAMEPAGVAGFSIVDSQASGIVEAAVLPDIATCPDCAREILDPRDRRHRYAFTNCTNCGPRYTIIRCLPYDRSNTSMSAFSMCPLCQREYDDPSDRRFHAQPNACPVCGPRLQLVDRRGKESPGDPIAEAARALRKGLVVAVKGLGGFHLAVDAAQEDAVAMLRARKHRWEKPLGVMAAGLDSVGVFAVLDDAAASLLLSPQKPIVLLPKREPFPLAEGVSPRNRKVGVMLPYTPVHILLMQHGFAAIVLTSGNLSEEPIACEHQDAFQRLGGIADLFLIHDRDILTRCDDSVVSSTPQGPRVVRRSRGMVPAPLPLPVRAPHLAAVGGELTNALCLTRGTQAFMSQHIGDLHGRPAMEFFRETYRKMAALLRIEPELVAHDMHPDYLSTVWAREESGIPTRAVQHHHAHVLACMAEHGFTEPVLGLAMDGAGYGPDGTTWGAEALLVTGASFQRVGRFRYVPLPGGDQAAREPWRMALAYVHLLNRRAPEQLVGMAGTEEKVTTLTRLLTMPGRFPVASSCGRLFDAVAAVTGLRGQNRYEGQAPMELEAAAHALRPLSPAPPYTASIQRDADCWIVAQEDLFQGVLDDIDRGIALAEISMRFHVSLAHTLASLACTICKESAVGSVALTGGCFQNEILSSLTARLLEEAGLDVLEHRNVPAGDGGIALGQAMAAALERA
jgi:hydrogenase maturation protein HypF